MSDDNVLRFPGVTPPEQSLSNTALVEMLEGFLDLARRGYLVSVGVAAVTATGDAIENFVITGQPLAFVGAADLLNAVIRQRILMNMSVGPVVRKEPDDGRDPDPETPSA